MIKFYFSLFDSVANPNYMDAQFNFLKPGKNYRSDVFVNRFYQLVEEVSENAAPILKYRLDPDMATYIKFLRTH